MASDVVTIPEEQGVETHGIERVSPETRTHVRIIDNFTMWLSANLVISTIGLGALAVPIFGLGFWDSVAVIIIFNALGVLLVALAHVHIMPPSNTTTAAEIASLLSFGGAVYGFATGWSSYAADYNVNQPEETPASRVFWLTFLGVFIPCVLLETLGMAFTTYSPWAATFANGLDRKSTRLNSSHSQISYAVFCLKKKKS